MLYLMLVGLFIGYIDSSKIEITTRPRKIKIFNQNGSINVEYVLSGDSSLYLKIKKKANGKLEKFKEWVKEVKTSIKEIDDFYEIKVELPENFKELKDKSVDLILSLPYTLDYIEANLLNGGIKIKNFISKKCKIVVLNGEVCVEEIEGEGEIGVNNGEINFIISHDKFLDLKLNVLNGGISISCPPFTQIFPKIVNGKIKGDLFFEKSDIFQKIECNVNNGDIKIKRR